MHVPRQLPVVPPPGAIPMRITPPEVGVTVAEFVAAAVGVIVRVCVIVGVLAGVFVSPGGGVLVAVPVGARDALCVGVAADPSSWHAWLQPSPLLRLPSSHCSWSSSIWLFPHVLGRHSSFRLSLSASPAVFVALKPMTFLALRTVPEGVMRSGTSS